MSDPVLYTLLTVGILAILGFAGDRLFQRTGIPDVLLLLTAGTLIGPVFGLVDVRDIGVITPYFGTLALIFILFDGGLELDFNVVLQQFLPVILLVLLSVGLVLAGVALFLIHGMGWHWLPAMLLATLLANTSGAIVLPVVSKLAIPEEDKTLLKLEAAASDVIVIILFVTLMQILQTLGAGDGSASLDARGTLARMAGSFSVAIVIGTVVGMGWILVMNRIHRMQHNYIATLGMMLTLYSIAEFLGASGMMAVLFMGIVLANSGKFGQFFNVSDIAFIPHDMRKLHTTFSFFIRTFFLIYVGFFISADMLQGRFLAYGLLVMGILVAGRIVTAGLFSLGFRKPKATAWAVAAMLPRGLAVAALAAAPGQLVGEMVQVRKTACLEAEADQKKIEAGLQEARARKQETAAAKDTAGVEQWATREFDLTVSAREAARTAAQCKARLEKLQALEESTSQFVLFASMSILVSNILMTLGCVGVRKVAGASNGAPPSPEA